MSVSSAPSLPSAPLPAAEPVSPLVRGRARTATAATAPLALGAALLVLILYAAFAHGAVGGAAFARVQVALAVVAALACGAWLWSGTLRFAARRLAYASLALLALFAIWSGISLAWSVAPDQTWVELNRVIAYALVLALSVMLGCSYDRGVELVAKGIYAIVLLVTAYGVGQKLIPGVHIGSLINLDHTGPLPRLQEPFGYWNALGLFIAMGVPIGLALVVDRSRTRRSRLSNLVALQCMFLAIGFTYSRGAIVALVVALAVGLAIAHARMRALMWLAVAAVASAPSLVIGLTMHALSTGEVALGRRESAGAVLAAVVLVSAVLLVVAARKLLGLEDRVRLSSEQARRITRGVLVAGAAALLLALALISLSSRGLGGTVSHAWSSFTTTRAPAYSDAKHLLSVDSENRWVWWKEAAGAFSDRPLTGWGAGSFPVVHLLYRRDALTVNQPHSVPLQWLAETGVVGTALAGAAFLLLLVLGIRAVRRWPLSTERLMGAAALAAGIAYVVHALYDWDWNIPGVTLPALVLLGVLAGSAPREQTGSQLLGRRSFPGSRVFALAALTAVLCVFAVSATLPSLAASNASAALLAADRGSLAQAQSAAALASKLDPLSDAGPRVEATIAFRERQARRARSYLLDAIARQPSDVAAWQELAGADLALGDRNGVVDAVLQVIVLDPRQARGALGAAFAASTLLKTPPRDSATAVATP